MVPTPSTPPRLMLCTDMYLCFCFVFVLFNHHMVAVVDNTFADGKDGRWVGLCRSFGLCQRKKCWLLSSAFRPHCMAFTSAVGSLRHLHTSFRWSLMAAGWQGQMSRVTEQDWNLLQSKYSPFLFCLFFLMLWFTVCFQVNLIWDVLMEKPL